MRVWCFVKPFSTSLHNNIKVPIISWLTFFFRIICRLSQMVIALQNVLIEAILMLKPHRYKVLK